MRALDILVVDDDHDLASGIADMLEAEGHRAALAGNGEAALEVARDRAFGMIFLDIQAARHDRLPDRRPTHGGGEDRRPGGADLTRHRAPDARASS